MTFDGVGEERGRTRRVQQHDGAHDVSMFAETKGNSLIKRWISTRDESEVH